MNMMRRSTFRIEVVGAGGTAVCVRGQQAASYRDWKCFFFRFQHPRAYLSFWGPALQLMSLGPLTCTVAGCCVTSDGDR
jgi:hypothetical protein